MNWPEILAAFDDTGLEALAPKGVVRRARRDFDSGLAQIIASEGPIAEVQADGQTVRMDAKGPKAARCNCPAGSLCRHVLLATMALRETTAAATPNETPDVAEAHVIEEILRLSQQDLVAFAGADWDNAVRLAAASPTAEVLRVGLNCTVTIADAPSPVTFLVGQGLKGAGFKGPKARTRTLVAACALILRAQNGIPIDQAPDEAPSEPAGLDPTTLDALVAALLRATHDVLRHGSPRASETLFDLAINARVDAAPRLASLLRGLSKQARHATVRAITFEPTTFLRLAAQTVALIEALRTSPADPALTGVLRRDYPACEPFDLLMLGATAWTSESGARGLTLHGFAPGLARWMSVTLARGPGQDPSFHPKSAYGQPLWGAPSAGTLCGFTLSLPDPRVAADGSIAPTLPTAPTIGAPIANIDTLADAGALSIHWDALRSDLGARSGHGLKRRANPLAALISPIKHSDLRFNDFTQVYEWEVYDQTGDAITLHLPGDDHELPKQIHRQASAIRAILVETSPDDAAFRPIALLFKGEKHLQVFNLQLDRPSQFSKSRLPDLDAIAATLGAVALVPRLTNRALPLLFDQALDCALAASVGADMPLLSPLVRRCEDAGLITLAAALSRLQTLPRYEQALRVAYLADACAQLHAR